jgi:hypothetical protein
MRHKRTLENYVLREIIKDEGKINPNHLKFRKITCVQVPREKLRKSEKRFKNLKSFKV